ncbi:hypothetical protein FQA39_LY10306 [Lamprigera yunnana]|nr:hypothetical protein FQA39_LY10306 [Lamprigera yunnana]
MDGSDKGFIYEFNKSERQEFDYACKMVFDAEGTTINNCILSQNHAYLAMGDGSIWIVTKEDFSNCGRMSMHDSCNSVVPKMCFSHDTKYFFTCGHDGNIFSYKTNVECITDTSRKEFEKMPNDVPDVDGYSDLSLEQLKGKIKADEQIKRVEDSKQGLLSKLTELKIRFENIIERNNVLPSSQQLRKTELELHPLITQYFNHQLEDKLEEIKKQLNYKVEKSKLQLDKLKRHFTDRLDFFPIAVEGIYLKVIIKTVNQKKVTPEFYNVLQMVEDQLREEEQVVQREEGDKIPKNAPIIENTAIPKRINEKPDPLFALSTQELKFGRKINQLLNRYRTRKLKLEKRREEWESFRAIRPLKKNSNEEHNILECASKNIGDYKLKSNPNYKVPKDVRMTAVKKYYQLLSTRLRQYNMIHIFNKKIFEMRNRRLKVVTHLQKLKLQLENVQDELNKKDRKPIPYIPEVDDHFIEKNLEVTVNVAEEKQYDSKKIIQPSKNNLLEKEVLLQNESEDTEWEKQVRDYRQSRKLFEQNIILKQIRETIQNFDDEVGTLAMESYVMTRDVHFLDLHMLTLNQELLILKDFETSEREINENINVRIKKLYELENETERYQKSILQSLTKTTELFKEGQRLKNEFSSVAHKSLHFNYLKTVFEGNGTGRCFKVSKLHIFDFELFCFSETSPSSENSLKGDIFTNGEEFNLNLYKTVIDLQSKRSDISSELKGLNNQVDDVNNKIRDNHEKEKTIEQEVKLLKNQLDKLQTEKQVELNKVSCTVVIRLNQLQHLNADDIPSKIENTLIFSQVTLTKLYKTVGQLHNETEAQQEKHKNYTTHMRRLKTDYNYMKESIKQLQIQIENDTEKKIGTIVEVDIIEEARLKEKLFKYNLAQTNVKLQYKEQIKMLNETIKTKQIELSDIIKENTFRVNLLKTLAKEKSDLIKILNKQDTKQQHLKYVVVVAEVCKEHIGRLSKIVKSQNQEIEILNKEIKRLNYKTVPVEKCTISDEVFNLHLENNSASLYKGKVWNNQDLKLKGKREQVQDLQSSHSSQVEISLKTSSLTKDTEEMIQSVIFEMLGHLTESSQLEVQKMSQQILQNKLSLNESINFLKNFLPVSLTTEQNDHLEAAARQILDIQSTAEAKELLMYIIEDVKTFKSLNTIEDLLLLLVQRLPIKFLIQKDTIDTIIEKLGQVFDMDKETVIETMQNISEDSLEILQEFVDSVLETASLSYSTE